MAVVGLAVSAAWSTATSTAIGALATRMLISTAVSALTSAALKQGQRGTRPGLRTEYTSDGGDQPMSFVLGWYATDGHMVCPPMSHGKFDDWRNAYLTYVVSLGNVPGARLEKVIVDDEELTFEADDQTITQGGPIPAGQPDWWYRQQGMDPANPAASQPDVSPGRPAASDEFRDKLWLRYYDGTQTEADPYLLKVYGPGTKWDKRSGRPWTADMVGVGTCYAILTFRYSTKSYSGLPRCRFVLRGTPLYDPRKDSTTAGGSGTQRWADPATWATTTNGVVLAYNILRGIPIAGGPLWGYGVPASGLPMSSWAPAMTAADQQVDGAPRWQAAYEVSVADEPADVLDEVLKASCAKVAEVGGVWRVRVGPPAAPVLFVTDDDIVLDDDATATPFPGMEQTFNAVHASYPEPKSLWKPKDAPPRYNAAWETADQSRRLVAELNLPACPWGQQVQRVMKAYIQEERRFRRHMIPLPPEAEALEPLDVIAVTSAEHGYDAKLFEVAEISEHPETLVVTLSLLEVDPSDYDWKAGDALPSPIAPVTVPRPLPAVPQYFTAEGIALRVDGRARGVAVRLRWGGWGLDGITSVRWEVRLAGQTDAARGMMGSPEEGETIVSPGLTPLTNYEARISFIAASGLPVSWTAWTAFKTPALDAIPVTDIDTTAPATPPAVTLSSTPTALTASWAADGGDVVYSDLEITEAGGNPVLAQTSGTRYVWQGVTPGLSYSVRRRRVDRVGNRSGWSSARSHTVALDTVPPATPTGLELKPGFRSIWLMWGANTEADLAFYEIRESTATFTPGAATPVSYTTMANNFLVADLPYEATRYYAVRAVDTSGNKSGWTAVASATTGSKDAITAADIQGVVDATAFANGIEPVSIVTSLPKAKATTVVLLGAKLYRWNGTKYTAEVASEDIAGQVTAGQIAGLEASKITGKLTDSQIDAIAAAKLTGKITETQISDEAISTPKLAAGAVDTAKIAAGAVDADKLAAKAVVAEKIATGAVETAKIAAGAVEADKLAARAVTAGKIAASAVSADELAADAVTTGKVAAGAINTREMMAGAVTASILGVGDFTNLVPDDQLQDAAAWTGSGTVVPAGGASWANSTGRITFAVSTANQWAYSKPFPVSPGDEFWATFQATFSANSAKNEVRGYVYFYDRTGAQISNTLLATVTTRTTGVWENTAPVIAPGGAVSGRFRFYAPSTNDQPIYCYAPVVRRKNGGKLIVDGAVKANHLTVDEAVITVAAQIASAIIGDAHITDLTAAKLRAGTALASTLTVDGTSLGTIGDRANDPATRINAKATRIDPGRIVVSGSTSLADWRMGGDETRIDGGALSANTVTANKLEIGSRNVTLTGIQFEHNKPGANQVSWTAGKIVWVTDTGPITSTAIAAGNATWTSGVLYIYWVKGAASFTTTTSLATAMAANNLCIATYEGGSKLDNDFGRTVIDGDQIKTGSVRAAHLVQTEAIVTKTAQIGDAVINRVSIGSNQLYAGKYLTRSDVTLTTSSSKTAPVALWNNVTIPNFDGGGYLIVFNGIVDSTVDYDSYGHVQLLIDGAVVSEVSVGMRTSGANTGGKLPIQLFGQAVGTSATKIGICAWSHTYSNADGGNAQVVLRNMNVTISGTTR